MKCAISSTATFQYVIIHFFFIYLYYMMMIIIYKYIYDKWNSVSWANLQTMQGTKVLKRLRHGSSVHVALYKSKSIEYDGLSTDPIATTLNYPFQNHASLLSHPNNQDHAYDHMSLPSCPLVVCFDATWVSCTSMRGLNSLYRWEAKSSLKEIGK